MKKCVTINWYDRHLYSNFERNRRIKNAADQTDPLWSLHFEWS